MRASHLAFDLSAPDSGNPTDWPVLSWLRADGGYGFTPGRFEIEGRTILAPANVEPEWVHQFVALYDDNSSERDPGDQKSQLTVFDVPRARLLPSQAGSLQAFWGRRIHAGDLLAVNPDTRQVNWIKKTFSQDEIDQYNWMMANVPGIDKSITVADLEQHAAGLGLGGSSLSFSSPPARATTKSDHQVDKKTLAITNLVFDAVICIIGLGPLLKAEAKAFNAIRRSTVDEAFEYAEWRVGEGSASAVDRHASAVEQFAERESSRFSELRARWPNASIPERYEMVSGVVMSIGLIPIKKIVLAALEGLSWKDFLLFGAIALTEAIAFFGTAGVVTAVIGVLEFGIMVDILGTDVVKLMEAYEEPNPPKPNR